MYRFLTWGLMLLGVKANDFWFIETKKNRQYSNFGSISSVFYLSDLTFLKS